MSGNVNSASTCINYAEEPIPEQFEDIIEDNNEVNPDDPEHISQNNQTLVTYLIL